MIHVEMDFKEKEREALIELSLDNEQLKKKNKPLKILICVGGLCFLLAGFLSDSMIYVGGGIALLCIAFVGIRPIQKYTIKRYYNKLDSRVISDSRIYDIDETGITITSSVGKGVTEWKGFIASGEINGFIWIQRVDKQIVLIDKSKLSETELRELKMYLLNFK